MSMKAFNGFALGVQFAGLLLGIGLHSAPIIIWCSAFGLFSIYQLAKSP